MKKLLLIFLCIFFICLKPFAQNVGIGTAEPYNRLQVNGSFVVTAPTIGTNTTPTVAQTKTMVNASTISFNAADSTGRIYDPGGPAGNYNANITAYADIVADFTSIGIELTVETMGLGTGDSLIVKNFANGKTLLAVGNNYNTTGKWVFNDLALYIIFKSNADANTSPGFSLLFRRLFYHGNQSASPAGYTGNYLSFDATNGSLQSGSYNTATGYNAVAIGTFSTASGNYAAAMGTSTIASGWYAFAIGNSTEASGSSSIALGNNTTASGNSSTAMGSNTTASGLNSTAMGNNASTNNQTNSLAIGGTGTATVCNSPNQFMARFDNYTFFVTPSSYAYLIPSSNGWAYTSDKNKKEKFEELDGETVLQKMAGIPLYSWNFKDSKPYRHYGIMAQDFYNAFGKDSYGTIGNDTTVSSLDLIGVAYSAIKALEKRTAQQQEENEQLKNENQVLQKKLILFEEKLNVLLAVKEKKVLVKTATAYNQ